MPRKIKTITTEEIEPAETQEIDDNGEMTQEEAADQQATDQIAEICRNMEGAGGFVAVYRKAPRGVSFCYAERMAIEDFQANGLEEIRKRYGGGTYRLRFHDHQARYKAQTTFSVDERLKGELDSLGTPAPTDNGKAVELVTAELSKKNSDFASIMVQMMQMQQNQHQQTLQLITAAMSQPKGTALKDIAAIAAPLVPVLTKLIEGRAQDGTMKTIEMLAKAKDLFGGDGGGSDTGSMMEKLLSSLAPAVVAKLQAEPAAPATPAQQPANVVALPEPQLPAPEIQQPQVNLEDPEMIKMLVVRAIRSYYPRLAKAAAKQNSDPASYFEVLMDDLEEQPPQVLGALLEILKQPDWAKVLFGVDVLPNPEWFLGLRQEFLDYAIEQQQPAEPTPAPAEALPSPEPPAKPTPAKKTAAK